MRNFKKLHIWSKAMDLTIDIYNQTKPFPKEERFALTNQIRKSSVSIPSNISEGCGRRTIPDQAHFMDIAIGSSFELETQILLAKKLGYLSDEEADKTLNEITFIQVALTNYVSKLRNQKMAYSAAGVILILIAAYLGVR
ncbi:MAG: four helix bundle protein [Bacteroidia bacterium]|jgi:four helix bundle protein|nr:four helix bundle protein [Bacteroidia bacterium]